MYRYDNYTDSFVAVNEESFPSNVDEYMEAYKCIDTEHIYSNGIEFVPIFRMKQWFDHNENKTSYDRQMRIETAALIMAMMVSALGVIVCIKKRRRPC